MLSSYLPKTLGIGQLLEVLGRDGLEFLDQP